MPRASLALALALVFLGPALVGCGTFYQDHSPDVAYSRDAAAAPVPATTMDTYAPAALNVTTYSAPWPLATVTEWDGAAAAAVAVAGAAAAAVTDGGLPAPRAPATARPDR